MAEDLPLVGTDACVLIEAICAKEGHPSKLVLRAAASHVFCLVLFENAEDEARRALETRGRLAELETLLTRCFVQRCPAPTPAEIKAAEPLLLPGIRHVNDIPIALAVRIIQPDAFISSNDEHWKPSLARLLGGVPILTPRKFLQWLARR